MLHSFEHIRREGRRREREAKRRRQRRRQRRSALAMDARSLRRGLGPGRPRNFRETLRGSLTRRGAIVLLSTALLCLTSVTLSQSFIQDVAHHYQAIRASAEGYQARQAGLAAFEAGIQVIKTVPEELLYQFGLMGGSPSIQIAKDCPEEGVEDNCLVTFIEIRVTPEDAKLNLNNLVRYDDERNETYARHVERLFFHMDIPPGNLDNIVDWIDENDFQNGGVDGDMYDDMTPPRKIKNARMYDISELSLVRGFDRTMIYEPRPDYELWARQREDRASLTETERRMLDRKDFILAHNVTAFLPYSENAEDKININGAPYHVLLSLSDFMTEDAVKAILKLRQRGNGYIKNLSDLQQLPEFQVQGAGDMTLYQELAGTGGEISGVIKSQSDYYRISGVGTLARDSDTQNGEQPVVREVSGLWDRSNRQLIFYVED